MLENEHDLALERYASGGTDKTGTSTKGNSGRRFFSEEVVKKTCKVNTNKMPNKSFAAS